jgi:hypothetical protein
MKNQRAQAGDEGSRAIYPSDKSRIHIAALSRNNTLSITHHSVPVVSLALPTSSILATGIKRDKTQRLRNGINEAYEVRLADYRGVPRRFVTRNQAEESSLMAGPN